MLSVRGAATEAVNPLHAGAGAAFSDAFLLLILPVLAALALAGRVPGASPRSRAAPTTPAPGGDPTSEAA